jgi:hypothetical protein
MSDTKTTDKPEPKSPPPPAAKLRASEATDPAVHKLLADRQAHQMNLDSLRPPENAEAVKAAEAALADVDKQLAELGYE